MRMHASLLALVGTFLALPQGAFASAIPKDVDSSIVHSPAVEAQDVGGRKILASANADDSSAVLPAAIEAQGGGGRKILASANADDSSAVLPAAVEAQGGGGRKILASVNVDDSSAALPAVVEVQGGSGRKILRGSIDTVDSPTVLSAADELEAEGFKIVPAVFTGPFGPDNTTISIEGTVEEVLAQIEGTATYEMMTAAADAMAPPYCLGWNSEYEKRKVAKKDCSNKQGRADYYRIKQGVCYLSKVGGEKPRLKAKHCSRVSCSYNAAIYLCYDPVKDSPKGYTQPWTYVADYANGVAEGWCQRKNKPVSGGYMVGGKVRDPKGLGVHVRADKC